MAPVIRRGRCTIHMCLSSHTSASESPSALCQRGLTWSCGIRQVGACFALEQSMFQVVHKLHSLVPINGFDWGCEGIETIRVWLSVA